MKTRGQIGYEAYAAYTGNKNFLGKAMPAWEELPEQIRGAWEYATTEAVNHTVREIEARLTK